MKYILTTALIALLLVSCHKERNAFEQSPSERMQQQRTALQNELTEAPYGWKVLYFPRTDSLLFATPTKAEKRSDSHYVEKLLNQGFGGFYFLMSFHKDNTVTIQADTYSQTIQAEKTSEYNLSQEAQLQLSFTTYNYVHQLVNNRFRAAADWLYVGKDTLQNMVFKTASYADPAREYIVFEKLKTAEDKQQFLQKAHSNRLFFEQMQNPQIVIKRGSKIYYQSDVYLKGNSFGLNTPFLEGFVANRYYVFEYRTNPQEDPSTSRYRSQFIGSGYVGTEKGLTFRAGLRYSHSLIFYDFVRQGNRFVAEHRDSKGIATGYIAEIFDN